MLSPELIYIPVLFKFGVNPSISFEVVGQNVILSGLSIWNGNGSSWLVLLFQDLVDSIDLTWHHVGKSSILVTNVMTDWQADRHTDTVWYTHRQTEWSGKKHICFQRYNDRLLSWSQKIKLRTWVLDWPERKKENMLLLKNCRKHPIQGNSFM